MSYATVARFTLNLLTPSGLSFEQRLEVFTTVNPLSDIEALSQVCSFSEGVAAYNKADLISVSIDTLDSVKLG